MGTFAQDTFIRANQSGWGTASDGESWTQGSNGIYSIASNEGVIASTSGNDSNAQLGSQTATDQIVSCRIAINNSGDICGVEGRYTGPGSAPSCYKLLYYSNDIHINKALSGANSNLVNFGGFTMTPGLFYQFKLQCQGTTISGKVWLNGATEPTNWMLSVTDSSIASGGFALLAQSSGGAGIQVDHFQANNLSNPTVTTTIAYGRDGKVVARARDSVTKATGRDGLVTAKGR
jgi:hypothetical protein